MTIKQRRYFQWSIAGVCAALLGAALSSGAFGQAQLNQDGHARDANPNLLNGGYNGSSPLQVMNTHTPGVVGNQIVQGTVSNGKGFQGYEPIPVPGAWQGAPLSGTFMNRFIQNSVGPGQPNQPAMIPNTSVPFYAQSLAVTPAGFVSSPTVGGNYLPAPMIQPRGVEDQRLGALLNQPTVALPAPGELLAPGAVDPSTNSQTYYVAGDLYSVKQVLVGSPSDQFLQGTAANTQQRIVLNQLQLDPHLIAQMQNELRDLSPSFAAPGANLAGGQPINAQTPTQSISSNNPLSTGQLPDKSLSSTLGQEKNPLAAANQPIQTGPLGYHPSPQAAQQSTQLGKMQQLLEDFYKSTDRAALDAVNIHNKEMMKPTPQTGGVRPTGTGVGGPVTPPPGPGGAGANKPNKPQPYVVSHLSEGVSAKGLHDLLDRGEGFMKAGKFGSAIDAYEAAEQVAQGQPVMPLVWIGLANANLGAGYYVPANNQLQQAFSKEPALLMAKYDLHSFIGDERLEAVVKDLKAAAAKDPTNPAPIFLLAYVSYNTNNERAAAAYLVLADQRSGGKDPIYKLIRDHWTLPEETPATQPANKR